MASLPFWLEHLAHETLVGCQYDCEKAKKEVKHYMDQYGIPLCLLERYDFHALVVDKIVEFEQRFEHFNNDV
jgi:hypothetical protein